MWGMVKTYLLGRRHRRFADARFVIFAPMYFVVEQMTSIFASLAASDELETPGASVMGK